MMMKGGCLNHGCVFSNTSCCLTQFMLRINKAVLVRNIPDVQKDSTARYMEVRGQLDVPGLVGPTEYFDIL